MKLLTAILLAAIVASLALAGHRESLLQRAPDRTQSRSNPYAGNPRAARAGAKLFGRECGACHGQAGQGIGKAPSLQSAEVAEASPGVLFWVLRNGSLWRGMPSFAHLPEPERWQIVTCLKTHGCFDSGKAHVSGWDGGLKSSVLNGRNNCGDRR